MKRLLLTVSLAGLAAWQVKAETLDFDLLSDNVHIPYGYNGLDWDNFYSLDGVNVANNYGPGYLNTGYHTGVVSPNNVAYNAYGNPASISGVGGETFDLNSGYVTAGWTDGLHFEVVGKRGGSTLFDNTYTVNRAGPTLIQFDYLGVDTVVFSTYGSTPQHIGQGCQFVVDNLTVSRSLTARVAEPSQIAFGAMTLLGVLGLGYRRWKKARKA